MRFELTVGVDPLQRFSKPLHIPTEMAMMLESIDELERELREHDTNTHTSLTQKLTQEKPSRGQHLYVLQDATGRIKIGRSGDPKKRCRDLQNASGRKINVVLILPNRGVDEQDVHAALTQYRGYGEWFANSDACRKAIAAALGAEIKWRMPSEQHVAEWQRKEREEASRATIDAGIARYFAAEEARKRGGLSPAALRAHNFVRAKLYGQPPLVLRRTKARREAADERELSVGVVEI